MGFDLTGLKPNNPKRIPNPGYMDWSTKPSEEVKNKHFKASKLYDTEVKGAYFRNNVWWWRPLWDYVCINCSDILNKKDIEGGSSNSGHKISNKKSKLIASRLRKLLKEGHTAAYKGYHSSKLEGLPEGDWDKTYPFSVENVIEFEQCCENSGGFEIS